MKKRTLLLSLIFLSFHLSAQSTRGTEFWFAYLENLDLIFNGPPKFVVLIEAEQTTDGQIQVPATGLTLDFTAPGGTITEVELPDAIWYVEGSELVSEKGIRVIADLPVSVTALHYRPYFSESTLVLPTPLLSDRYLPTCYVDDNNFNPSASFVILSTTDNDEIEIIPTALTEGLRPAGLPFSVTLNAGQVYQVRSQGDLTGTQVKSLGGNPIALFSGARQATVDACGGADSHLWDQALPLSEWDTRYYFVPFKGQGGDIVKIVAALDNTSIFFDCEQEIVLNAGESYQIKLFDPVVISGSDLISVAQFNTSQGCNPSNLGDPNMLQLLPVDRQLSRARIRSLEYSNGIVLQFFTKHFINIVMPLAEVAGITLDGGSVPASFFPFSGNADYAYAQVEVSPGEHLLESAAPFYAYSYGFGDFDAYTYNAGYEEIVEITVADFTLAVEGTPCVDSVFTVGFEDGGNTLSDPLWSIDGETVSMDSSFTYVFEASGNYTIRLDGIDGQGCPVSLTEALTIEDCAEEEECEAVFPTVFTPNGDGRNDTFRMLFTCRPTEFSLQVYSRWGELVYDSKDPDAGWDGNRDGQAFPSDVLVWLASYVPANAANVKPVFQYGEITLLR